MAAVLLFAMYVTTVTLIAPAAGQDDDGNVAAADAATNVPLYEQPPRDWLLLRNDTSAQQEAEGGGEEADKPAEPSTDEPNQIELYVLPITFTGPDAIEPGQPRHLPEERVSGRSFLVRLADQPDEEYQVYWRDVIDIRLYEQRLIDEAEKLVAAGKYDEAFGYYQFLDTNYPDFAGVQESLQRFLLREAGSLFTAGQIERATLLLVELYERNSDHPRVSRALGMAVDVLVERSNNDKDYAKARQYLDTLVSRFPDHPVTVKWQQQWEQSAASLIHQGEAEAQAGHMPEAHALVRRALDIWPSVDGAAQLAARIAEHYQYVAVGVTEPTTAESPARSMVSWSSRRRERLLQRKLVELADYRTDGATFASPFGQFESTDLGLGLRLNIAPGIEWQPGGGELCASDVSRHLLAMANPSSTVFDPLWADLFRGVNVSTAQSLTATLSRGYVRPEALLQVPVAPWNLVYSADDDTPSLGGYVVMPPADDGTHFLARPHYFAAEDGQPNEINERVYASTAAALTALRQGKITAIDRIAPWELARLSKQKDIVVTPYAVPIIHCLVPGRANQLTQSRVFRRALVYGIDRQQILDKWLLHGIEVPGCRVVTGPFPVSYAYDEEIEPRGFKPQLGMTLAWTAWESIQAAEKKAREKENGSADVKEADDEAADENADASADQPPEFPELTLAYPPDEIATRACRQIQQYLKVLGVPIRLVPIDPAEEWDLSKYDLIYAELFVSEPAVDTSLLFGPGGLIEGNSPFLDEFVRGVELATDSRTARAQLFAIHRRVYEDLPIIPLWQLTEHFATTSQLTGAGTPASSLYDSVEQWRVPPWTPGGKP